MKSAHVPVSALALSLCLYVVAPATAAFNFLDDPSVEAATSGTTVSNSNWVLNANTPDGSGLAAQFETASFASYPDAATETGVWFRSFEGVDGGTLADAELSQTVVDVPGGWYRFIFHAKREANFTADAWFAELSSDGTGGSASINLLAAAPADGEWYEYSVYIEGVTALDDVTVRVVMTGGVNSGVNPQSAFVDNFILIPEPASIAALGIGLLTLTTRRRRTHR